MLALEFEFEMEIYLHDGGYDTNANYYLPQPLNESTHIYAVPSEAHWLPGIYNTHLPIYLENTANEILPSSSSPQPFKL